MGKKIGRNDPCPCGSGKKYKKCCFGKEDNPEYSDITKFADIYKATRKAARFNKPSVVEMPGMMIDGKTGFDMAVADFEEEKKIFDKALIEKRYDVLTSIVWEFNGFSNFAATAGETPMYDFDGKQIQDLLNPSVPARHVYTCVFPENGKTYVIIAWLKEYDGLFLPMKEKLETLTEDEEKNYINNTIAITTENVVIKPSAWDAMPETAKQAFSVLFLGMADMLALDGKPYNRFEKPSFDLFSI